MARPKLQNVGEAEVVDNTVSATQESEAPESAAPESAAPESAAPSPEEEAQTEEDLSNVGEADDEKARRRGFNILLKEVGKLGETYGAAGTSKIYLAEAVTEAAMHRSIKPDDAETIYDRFNDRAVKGATLDNGMEVEDAADEMKSKPQQVSKLRTFIKLGGEYTSDAADVIRRARDIHLSLTAPGKDRNGVVKGSTYNILVDVARAQLDKARAGVVLTDDELYGLMTCEPIDKTPPDGAKKILDALIAASAARKGGKERAPIQDNEHLDRAIDELRGALGDVAPDRLTEYDDKAHKKEEKAAK